MTTRHKLGNKLLDLLPQPDLHQLTPHLQPIALPRGTVLGKEGKPIEYVYFLTNGLCSVLATTPEGHSAEAGIFGYDGYIPSSAAAEVDLHSYNIQVQIDGEGYRMPYSIFSETMKSRNFFVIMIRAIEAFSVQLSYTALSNAVHDVNVRLARWLLMCDDRVAGPEIPLTHDFIALMLAVRRPSVTTALHVLEGNGFIKAERGLITIRNRGQLEEFAHDAYGKPEAAYQRLMGGLFPA